MKSLKLSDTQWRYLVAALLAVGVFVFGKLTIQGFGTPFSIRAILVLTAFLGIAAVGQTLVILIGGIDLSIPYMISYANVITAQLTGQGVDLGIIVLIVLGSAALIGAFNGGLSARLKIHPLIVTLGVGNVVQGAVLLWVKGFPSGKAPPSITQFVSMASKTGPFEFPPLILFWLFVGVVVLFILHRTVYGRQLYALGSNPEAARLALVRPICMWMITFALSAVFAGIAGILLVGFTNSASATAGQQYLFQTIAAVVIGGTSLLGGKGDYGTTIIGAFILIELVTVLTGLRLSAPYIQAATGVIIMVLVSIYGRDTHVRNMI
ncbi:MAG: ABC transporter permease [Anaerolineae bacterium]|nr:ABC transporter permease [Anaerolineae bacterium]